MSAVRSANGGGVARRAVIRWAWRLFRREWRQQILVLALLTVAVTAAIGGASAAYSAWLRPWAGAQYGTANQAFTFYTSDPNAMKASVSAVQDVYGVSDVIARRYVPVPGSTETVEVRSQDPKGPYGGPMLALREGRFPARDNEIAVTESVARTFALDLGSRFAPDGATRTVVGLVENPSDLRDKFALVAPSQDHSSDVVTVLVVGSSEQAHSLSLLPGVDMGHSDATGGPSLEVAAAVGALAVETVAMFLVALVAAAGFVVVAQRRLRQLGMLAAIGATQKHLRLVMLANGAVVGAAAAVVGAALGLAVWIAVAPAMESAVAARIDRFDLLPWWLLGAVMLLAVATAIAAAWWPARTVARIPVISALSGRPPRPKPPHRSVALAGSLLVVGVVYLVLAGDPGAHWINGLLIGAGTFALILGVLFISPPAIQALAAGAGPLPVPVRLAMRDLARYQARSGAALAAISLTLGISVAVVIAVTAAEPTPDEVNLSDRQLLITERGGRIRELVTMRTPAQLQSQQAQIDRIVAPLDDPAVMALDMAVDPADDPRPGRTAGNASRPAVLLGDGGHTAKPGPLFVATPHILDHYGIDPGTADVLTVRTGEVGLRFKIEEEVVANVKRIGIPAYASAPTSFITLDGLRRRGWEPARAGWFVEARTPLTGDQLAHAHSVAASADLMIETGEQGVPVAALRASATAVGTLLALAVLAMTVGLIRATAAGELRTLTATGATSRIRRTITATTAGALGLLGVTLGTGGTYLGTVAMFADDLDTLTPIPVLHLLVIVVGVPLVAVVAGWLLAGREPPALARQPIE